MGGIRVTQRFRIAKPHLLPNPKSDRAQTCWEALGPHGDLELLKLFHSDIQDGCYGGHFENLQTTSPPKPYVMTPSRLWHKLITF